MKILPPPDIDAIRKSKIEPLQIRSTNLKYLLTFSDDSKWVAKFHATFGEKVTQAVNREVMVSRLGLLLDLPVLQSWHFPGELIFKKLPLEANSYTIGKNIEPHSFVLSPYLTGTTIADNREEAEQWIKNNLSSVADILAFMHWIGDEDRSINDLMLVDDELILIDNGLCGPRNGERELRSYHPSPLDFSAQQIIKKCHPGKPSFVDFLFGVLGLSTEVFMSPGVIGKILAIDTKKIAQIVADCGLSQETINTLVNRRITLQSDYHRWLDDVGKLFPPKPQLVNPSTESIQIQETKAADEKKPEILPIPAESIASKQKNKSPFFDDEAKKTAKNHFVTLLVGGAFSTFVFSGWFVFTGLRGLLSSPLHQPAPIPPMPDICVAVNRIDDEHITESLRRDIFRVTDISKQYPKERETEVRLFEVWIANFGDKTANDLTFLIDVQHNLGKFILRANDEGNSTDFDETKEGVLYPDYRLKIKELPPEGNAHIVKLYEFVFPEQGIPADKVAPAVKTVGNDQVRSRMVSIEEFKQMRPKSETSKMEKP